MTWTGALTEGAVVVSLSAVLDACVLYPMYLRDTLLRAAEAGLYRVHWSADILAEVSRNLVANGHVSPDDAERLVVMMQGAFPEANVAGYQPLIASMVNDPKDRHVAAAAVSGGAEIIVTDNVADFPEAALSPFNLEALSADALLIRLHSLDTEAMHNVLVAQAADYTHPPMSLAEVLDRLVKQAPGFVRLVRSDLGDQS